MERAERTEAERVILAVFGNQPAIPAADGQKVANEAGIPASSIYRARKRLGIVTTKSTFSGGWWWALPARSVEGSTEDSEGS
jgi:hypothetical protein